MMEVRIARIETDMGRVKVSLSGIETDVREIKGSLKAANDAIAKLANRMTEIDGRLNDRVTRVEGGALIAKIGSAECRLYDRLTQFKYGLAAEIRSVERRLDNKFDEVIANLRSMEARIIKWFVCTAIGVAGVAFLIARFILPPIAQADATGLRGRYVEPGVGIERNLEEQPEAGETQGFAPEPK